MRKIIINIGNKWTIILFVDVDYDRFLFDIAELMRDKERFRKEFLRANQLED